MSILDERCSIHGQPQKPKPTADLWPFVEPQLSDAEQVDNSSETSVVPLRAANEPMTVLAAGLLGGDIGLVPILDIAQAAVSIEGETAPAILVGASPPAVFGEQSVWMVIELAASA